MSATLQFGTAGLRARMGPGPDEFNRETVRRASAGLAAYVNDRRGDGAASIVVGHDARHGSAQFARDAAAVFAGAGIRGLLISTMTPTPVLAYAVRALGCDAGVMVTASHNPAADNGYKVYGADGAQIIPPADAEISRRIAAAPADIPLGEADAADPTIVARYLSEIVPAALAHVPADRALGIVYTPVHGVGRDVALPALQHAGFPAPHVVAEQSEPDPDFPTAPRPNPEEPGVLDLALRDARALDADIVLANDPDADRLAVAVPWPSPGDPQGWRTLSGDEVGALLAEQLLRGVGDPAEALLVTTVVSGSLLRAQARAAGARYAETLTGFKWIMHAAESSPQRLLLGYEQALGYGVTELVRDKDGISAALVMAALAAHAKAQGLTVKDRLDAIAERFGLYATAQHSIEFTDGLDAERAAAEVDRVRADPPATLLGEAITAVDDLTTGERRTPGAGPVSLGLPPSSGVVLHAGETIRLAVRPSGTEPKLKLYLQVVEAVDRGEADAARSRAADRLGALAAEAETLLGGS